MTRTGLPTGQTHDPRERGRVAAEQATIEYVVARSRRRRKTIGFTVQPGGLVEVWAPMRTPRREIEALLARRVRWIARAAQRATASATARQAMAEGVQVRYLGQPVPLCWEPSSSRYVRVVFGGDRLVLQVPQRLDETARPRAMERALRRWYLARAGEELARRVAAWALRNGRAAPVVRVGQQRRLWGSCGPDGTLRFNWRLVMAPPELIDYVVAHEVCHLRVRNHSPAFWAEVAQLIPDYRQRRAALRALAPELGM